MLADAHGAAAPLVGDWVRDGEVGVGRAARRCAAMVLGAVCVLHAGAAGAAGSGGRSPKPLGRGAACAWPVRADRDTMNLAYPDTAATYWVQRYSLPASGRIEVAWRRPHARYSSLVTYDPDGRALDAVADRAAGLGTAARTVVTVASDGAPGGRALRAGTVRAGRVDGTLIYRVYVPDQGRDARGGVALPTLTLVRGSRRTRLGACTAPGASPDAAAAVAQLAARPTVPVPPAPVFIRPRDDGGNLYPNPDNTYLATLADAAPGRVVVVRGRAPAFPDTEAGDRVTGREAVRYWSFCTNVYASPFPVTACAHDARFPLDAAGEYTLVVSRRVDRPAAARRSNGVVWLPWGSTRAPMLLLMRNLLADPADPVSAASVAPGAPATTMGPFAPRAVLCTRAAFERGGPAACGI
jgi:hypothetical protein